MTPQCPVCGAWFCRSEQPRGGRPQRYCSLSCKRKALRIRKRMRADGWGVVVDAGQMVIVRSSYRFGR